jgi:hypothetical protein
VIIEIDDDLLTRWSAEQLQAVRPLLEELAVRMRRSLRLLDSLLGVESDRPDLAREHDRLCYDLHEVRLQVEALEHDLSTARAWIETLQVKVAQFEDDEIENLYASVGLSPNAHDVVVRAARRALLGHYHPDRASHGDKSSMASRFAAASAAFDTIMELRG